MNYKTLIAAAALALGTASAFAVEAVPFTIEESVLTRAEVRAELARAAAAGELDMRGEAYGSFATSDTSSPKQHADTSVQASSRNFVATDYIGG